MRENSVDDLGLNANLQVNDVPKSSSHQVVDSGASGSGKNDTARRV